ncbi:uncharacterized protein [Chiloscyllium punctatum]|uniref:uncharacterized protein n=1 Tax=Chiloscyllium punctatum TaxID=137246 RepID=UPI003B642157
MGSSYSNDNAVHSPVFNRRKLESLRDYLLGYQPPRECGKYINILLFGMEGAGISATINTFLSALDPKGRITNLAPIERNRKSLTPTLNYCGSNYLRFWDLAGWNALENKNDPMQVFNMILEGRILPGTDLHEFNPSFEDKHSIIPENIIHGVAFVFDMNTFDNIDLYIMKQFQELQTLVAQKYIYRIVIGTKFDQLGIPERYYSYIYNYKLLQEKFQKLSEYTGMDRRTMFAIINTSRGDKIGQTRCMLTLYILENLVRNINRYFKMIE